MFIVRCIVCLCIYIVICVLFSVSFCCLIYCLCVNVYLQLPPVVNLLAINKIYQLLYDMCVLQDRWLGCSQTAGILGPNLTKKI